MLFLMLMTSEPQAGYAEGKSCVNTKVSDNYLGGWRLRTAGAFEIPEDDTRYYLVTLASTIEYKIVACADDSAESIQVVVYNNSGRVISSSEPAGRDAELSFDPPKSGSYFIGARVVSLADVEEEEDTRKRRRKKEDDVPAAGVGLGILYK